MLTGPNRRSSRAKQKKQENRGIQEARVRESDIITEVEKSQRKMYSRHKANSILVIDGDRLGLDRRQRKTERREVKDSLK